ncbi:hypothetical protein [Streptomyces sp. NPDC001389]|uniref:hypothetical protein n=1 Tax=Streptomyces sp. NPDC001389 TaxID=3364569 RepID=UPI0036A1A9D1
MPANHVLEVCEELDVFLDDRPDSLDAAELQVQSRHPGHPDSAVRALQQGRHRVGKGLGTRIFRRRVYGRRMMEQPT